MRLWFTSVETTELPGGLGIPRLMLQRKWIQVKASAKGASGAEPPANVGGRAT